MRNKIKSYTFSHKGKRKFNEDYLIADDESGIFIVADGIGGARYGNLASRTVSEAAFAYLKDEPINQSNQMPFFTEFLKKTLRENIPHHDQYSSTGTTFASVQVSKDLINVIHAGDSRVYLLNTETKKFWKTKDHSIVQELVDMEIIKENEARHHPLRNVITNSIGISSKEKFKELEFDSFKRSEFDLIVIVSDGIFETYSEKSLLDLLFNHENLNGAVNTAKNASISYSSDNVTLIAAKTIENKAQCLNNKHKTYNEQKAI